MKKSPAQAVQAPGLFNRIFGAGGRAARTWPARYLALAVLLVAGATFGGVFAVANAQDAEGAISGLTLTSDSPGTLAVSWDAPDTSPSDYRVNWARADESYPAWTSDEGNRHPEGTSVELTGLDQDVEYKVRVRARYHKGEYADDPWSGPWADARLTVAGDPEEEPTPTPTPTPTATPEPSPTPVPRGTISGLSLSSDEPGSLSIAWNAPDLAPTDYRVVWAPVGDGFPSWKDENTADKGNSYPDGDATSLTLGGLPQGAETKVMVRARYHDGDHAGSPWSGPWSTQVAQRVRGAAPAAPSAVAVTVVEEDGGTLVRLIWLAPEHDALTGYRIWRGPDADSLAVLVEDTGSTATTYDDTTVAAGESYRYAVAALSPDGTGARAVSPEVVAPEPETSEPLVAQQQSSTTVLVSNLGQPTGASAATAANISRAQSFFVGRAPFGSDYRIDRVKVRAFLQTAGTTVQPSVSVYSDDNGLPGTSLFTLEVLGGFASTTTSTEYTLSAPSGSVLSGPNRYWVVFENASSDIVNLEGTSSHNENQEPPPATGWSIGDDHAARPAGDSWEFLVNSVNIKIAVLGSPQSPRPPPLVSNLGQPTADDSTFVGYLGVSDINDFANAVSFVTGPNAEGYKLRGAQLETSSSTLPTQGTVKAAVYSDNGGKPGSSLHVLDQPSDPQAGVLTFTTDSPYTLDAGTTYWLVMEMDDAPEGTIFSLELTGSTREKLCTELGWSIGNQRYKRDNSSDPWSSSTTGLLKAAILGDAVSYGCPAPVHEPESGDLPADTTTTGWLAVDGLGSHTILRGGKEGGDEDWFGVELEAGVDYQFDQLEWIEGEAEPTPEQELYWAGNLPKPGDTEDFEGWNADFTLYDSNGAEVPGAVYQDRTHVYGKPGIKNRIVFRPAAAGIYYVGIEGNFNLNPDRVWVNAVLVRKDDYPADTTTTAAVEVGGLKENYLMVMSVAQGDVDWIRVSLEAGVKYQFTYYVGRCGHEAVIEGIYDSSGTLVDGTASSGKCWTTLREFTPDTGGDYYIAVSGRGSHFPRSSRYAFRGVTGALYVWSDTQGSSPEPEDGDLPGSDVFTRGHVPNNDQSTGGGIDGTGDVDWFSVWLDEGVRYRIVLDGTPAPGKTNDLAGNLRLNIHRNLGGIGRGTTENDNPDVRAYAAEGSSRVVHTYRSMHTGSRQPSYTGIHWLGVSAANDATGDYTIKVNEVTSQQIANTPATGGPGITGSQRTGETLTATTDGIEDEDGLSSPGFSYQWVRHDLATATDTDIDGETGAAYTVTAEDEGKALKVRVVFTDDAGNEESMTSYTLAVAPPLPLPPVEPEASLTASVVAKPDSHDSETAFTFELQLSEEPKEGFSYVTMRDHAFTVTGGTVTGARRLEPPGNMRWEITVTPDSNGDVTIVLPITEDCDEQGAICTEDGRMLSNRLEFTVSGPEASTSALTASVESAPMSHDGSDAFRIRIAFSEEPREGFSYVTMRDHAFTVTGGSVTGARRLDPPGNMRWEITVTPDSNGDVTIVLPVTEDCDEQGAVCTDDDRMMSNRLEITVPGPDG